METVLITGANRGIGLELTKRFLETGRHVVATAREPDNSTALQAMAVDELTIASLDVADEPSTRNFLVEFGDRRIDILIHNAGVFGGDTQGLGGMDYEAWRAAFEVNTIAPFRLTAGLRDNLRGSERPRVIAISSKMGSLTGESVGSYAYRSTKAAVNKVMQVLAHELAEDGVIVCPMHPGWVRTDMGGESADLSPEESAHGLVTVIDGLQTEHSGRFWMWDGSEHPW